MPSLQQLNEFKASFRSIGNEPSVLSGQHVPYNDLPLPDSEPETPFSFDTPAASPAPAGTDDSFADFDPDGLEDFSLPGDFGDSPPADETPGPGMMDDLAFNDFLNTMPDDLPLPPEPSQDPAAEAFRGEAAPKIQASGEDGDEFAFPEDLLSGLADDLAYGHADDHAVGPEENGIAEGQDEDSFLDDSSFGDFSSGSDNSPDFSADLDFGGGDGFADAGETTGDESGFEKDAFLDGNVQDLPSDPGLESGYPPPGAGETGDLPPPGFDVSSDVSPDEFSIPGLEPETASGPQDNFDAFDIGEDAAGFKPETGGQGVEGTGGGPAGLGDFSLPGIDDIFNKAAGTIDAAGAVSAAVPVAPVKIEDIVLSEGDLARFRKTLAGYPLNLRIASEEIIAEQGAPADQLDALIKLIVRGGSPKEAASLAGKILNRSIPIPKGFEKKTGEELEAEQITFAYVFSRKFLPVLRIFLIAALMSASLAYLAWQFIYIPLHSESIYRRGYERIAAGEYERANERFGEAFALRRVKQWFYRYAEAFRDERQYLYAEEKYDELLRYYPRDKKGALDYADLETRYLRNYSKADRIIRTNILDYQVDDREGLLALGDNNLAWGEIEPARYENARQAYTRLLERYGWQDPIAERMLLYFIRTDDLGQVIPLQRSLTGNPGKKTAPAVLSELGGYLLNKQLEEVRGVPDANIERIEGVRDILIRAVQDDPSLPEPRYHLARYYNRFGASEEERQVLESALRAFDTALEESPRRTAYRIDGERRFARTLANAREFFSAEERLVKGIGIYEDALNRRLLSRSPEYGRLYADLGDIEYFTKSRDMDRALEYYRQAELNGWAPPEIQYRMGAAYYHQRQWENALDRFFTASSELPLNRRLLHALGNVSYLRGSYFAAQGYYRRLLDLLEAERARFPMLSPNERPDHMELAERLMVARNNMAVTMEALTARTGDPRYRAEAMASYAESARAWDALTRNPDTMIRSTGTNLGFLNSRNILHPQAGYEPRLFNQIDKDVLEPSSWETLAPPDFRISD